MNDRYRLGGLEDGQLLAALSALVRRDNDSLSDLLAHLAELDERAVCVALGYSSLFAYCTEALGFAREVYVRDEGRCTFCSDDGRRCGGRHLLQLDHVIPHAEGGEPTVTNLRLRCRAHNLYTARAHFGREYLRAAAE